MKKIFLWIMGLALMSCGPRRTKVISGLEGYPLPTFNLLLTDSTTQLNTNNIRIGQPFVLFYFSPSCPYCRAQTEEIKDNIKSLKQIQIYFITAFPLAKIKDFEKHYSLSKYNNITVAQVYDTSFFKYFKIPVVPYIAIYDREKKLKEVLIGKTSLNDIKDIALKN